MTMSQDKEIKRHYPKFTRREFGVLVGAFSFTLMTATGKIMASKLSQSNLLTLEESLQNALRAIGSDVTMAAADNFARSVVSSSILNLHLRNARITASDVKIIANALDKTPSSELARLGSFSLSYNTIGDQGAMTLANALPKTLTELGLVGCSIGDQGGKEILEWAKITSGLRLICIEENNISEELRNQFRSLKGMSVFV
jgi:hypothetical protein